MPSAVWKFLKKNDELDKFFSQPALDEKADPVQYWIDCRRSFPALSKLALKYLTPVATSVSSERVASAINLTVPNGRSRLTAEHIDMRVFMLTLSNKYCFD